MMPRKTPTTITAFRTHNLIKNSTNLVTYFATGLSKPPPAMSSSAAPILSATSASQHQPRFLPSLKTLSVFLPKQHSTRPITKLHVASKPFSQTAAKPASEKIFFDGGAHYGDLAANLLLGFTLVWLPLTLAAVFRAFFLRYRFTNLRVTVISGLTGQERSDFGYDVVKDVQVVPRFIGEWGDIIITLKDGTKVDLRSVPKFREIAKYCLSMADKPEVPKEGGTKGF